jgi:BirA family biotin operon repressor/biotin-[acetyl-CoA-carboxylase] ligase
LLIGADVQGAGRGRRGRVWHTPPGGAILASLLLRPRTPLEEAFAPTMILALAIQEAARAWGAPAVVKWPNDVLCRGRKLAGILCEAAPAGGRIEWVVAGFGVNVAFDPAEVGLGEIATSLHLEVSGDPPARDVVLARILAEAEVRYDRWQAGGYAAIWTEWRDALITLGRAVRIDPGDGPSVEGTAVRVDADGALVVATATGEQRVVAGTLLD